MNTRRQVRRGSDIPEGEGLKVLFEEFTTKTTETITQTVKKILEEKLEGLERRLEQKMDIIEKRLKNEIQQVKKQVDICEERREEEEKRLTLLELKEKERYIRIRGVEEGKEENIKELLIPLIADLVEGEEEKIDDEIEKIYRVNSKYAKINKKPRDIVIEFSGKKYRDMVIQAAFKKKIEIGGNDITIFKEIPGGILKKRKEYKFLTDLLKKHEINFRWENIEGVNLMYKGQRYRLNSIYKAKDFYKRLEKELQNKKEPGKEQE